MNKEMIKIANTNWSRSGSRSMVSAYKEDKTLIARVYINKRNPLAYLKAHNGMYRESWIEQFKESGLSREDALQSIGI